MNNEKQITNFLYEIGTMRKLLRMHRQTLLTDDMTDNIATHSYRVTMIGWFIAKEEGLDLYKTVMMCLLHDIREVRTGDQNYIHKRYLKVFDEEVINEQLGTLPHQDFKEILIEYEKRESKEALAAKDADLIDQILLLREYEHQGNKEAKIWLSGSRNKLKQNIHLANLKLKISKKIGKTIFEVSPSDWWTNIWTNKNRKK